MSDLVKCECGHPESEHDRYGCVHHACYPICGKPLPKTWSATWSGYTPWSTKWVERPEPPDPDPPVLSPRLQGYGARMRWMDQSEGWPETFTFDELDEWLAGWDLAHRRCVMAAAGLPDVGHGPLRKGHTEHFTGGRAP
jgi:hypothetical protein